MGDSSARLKKTQTLPLAAKATSLTLTVTRWTEIGWSASTASTPDVIGPSMVVFMLGVVVAIEATAAATRATKATARLSGSDAPLTSSSMASRCRPATGAVERRP